jgi:hypothetical protein
VYWAIGYARSEVYARRHSAERLGSISGCDTHQVERQVGEETLG